MMLALASATLCIPAAPGMSRRAALLHAGTSPAAFAFVGASLGPRAALGAAPLPPLEFSSAEDGLRWAELKPGAGAPFRSGDRVSIDYIMTRRGGAKIHSTVEAGEPFSWTLGDGSVIAGLEQAVGGGGGVPPMLAGGARRVIVPMALGYGSQTTVDSDRLWQIDVRELGPVPPPFVWLDKNNERVDSYLRFKNLFQNPNAFNQPDLVLDIRLRAAPGD
jgi:hypothetical protein